VWLKVAGLELVKHADGHHAIIPKERILSGDIVEMNELRPVTLSVANDCSFSYQFVSSSSVRIYERDDPARNQAGLREALPNLYLSFRR
jgi:hypothetical protein